MDIIVNHRPIATAYEGPHQLAWETMLDEIFRDAFDKGVGALSCWVPSVIEKGIIIRGDLTPVVGTYHAAFFLEASTLPQVPHNVSRIYFVKKTQGRQALSKRSFEGEWALVHSHKVLSFKSRLLGIPIRGARWANRPDWVDQIMRIMREQFEGTSAAALYQLEIYERVGQVGV